MHRNAEEGISAHWKYKEGLAFLENDHRLDWFREMIDYHKTNPDPKEFLSLVKRDLTPNEIYVFTPKGKVVNLKAGATPIDFAYAIHSEVGDHCRSAIVNEKLVPLRTPLSSGDVVEIVTQKNVTPSADWLKYAVTTRAKTQDHDLPAEGGIRPTTSKKVGASGRRSCANTGAQVPPQLQRPGHRRRLQAIHYSDLETFLQRRGRRQEGPGPPDAEKPVPRGQRRGDARRPKNRPPARGGALHKLISVEGQADIDFTIRQVLPPDQGRGDHRLLTKNRGLVVHKKDCPNVNTEIPSRLKRVSWNEAPDHAYQVKLQLLADDKPGMLSTISGITAASDSNIKKIELEPASHGVARVTLVFEVRTCSS